MLELGARQAVDHIRHGDMTAEAYVARLLDHQADHKHLNAFITVEPSRVLERARAIDLQRMRGEPLGRAAGLAFGVKDQINVAGMPATCGSGLLRDHVPTTTATVVDALVGQGAIVFGKTNMPDMVAAGTTLAEGEASANRYFGVPRNPYDPARIAGGTSGGNAVGLAARIIPAAIGEDTGGSIRLPSACCGTAGLRPSTYTVENAVYGSSRKRYPDDGAVVGPAGPLDTWGPMARTAADVAFLDNLITGDTVREIDLRDVRIGIPQPGYWDQPFVDQRFAQSFQLAFAQLRAVGAQLVEVDFDAVRGIAVDQRFRDALQIRSEVRLGRWLEANLPGVTIAQIYEIYPDRPYPPPIAPPPAAIDPSERLRRLRKASSAFKALFRSQGILALASPMMTIPAPTFDPRHERSDKTILVNGKAFNQAETLARNLFWGPRLGAPGLALPVGLVGGLPVSIELTGPPGRDCDILAAGIAVERILGALPPPTLTAQACGAPRGVKPNDR